MPLAVDVVPAVVVVTAVEEIHWRSDAEVVGTACDSLSSESSSDESLSGDRALAAA